MSNKRSIPRWMLWIGGFMLLAFVSYNISKHGDAQPPTQPAKAFIQPVPSPSSSSPAQPAPKRPQVVTEPEQIKAIREAQAVMEALKPQECPDTAEICLSLLNGFASSLFDANQVEGLTSDQKAQVTRFRTKLISLQQRALPIIRKAYMKTIGDTLWEHDVTARVFGEGNRTLELVGGVFAANRNIKATNDSIWPLLAKLRFTRVQYRWMKRADGTAFNFKTSDSIVLMWDDSSHIVEVK